MEITLQQLAELVQGTVVGDPTLVIHAAKAIAEAQSGHITFLENEKKYALLHDSKASAVVVSPTVPQNGKAYIQVKDPLSAFIVIVQHFQGRTEPEAVGVDPRAYIHPTAKLGSDANVYPFAFIGEGAVLGDRCRVHPGVVVGRFCKIGHDVTLHANAVLYEGVELGNGSVVHANAVLGADGFGYRFQNGRHVKVPQLGVVKVGAEVEIGAGTTIDRGTFQATVIGDGTKIDNQVQVAHNCRIGKHNILVSQVGIAGSCSTEDYVVLAGQVGIADHIHIGAGATVGAKAGVTKDVPAGQRYLGAPATPEREQKRMIISLDKIPEIRRDLRRIKQQLGMTVEEQPS